MTFGWGLSWRVVRDICLGSHEDFCCLCHVRGLLQRWVNFRVLTGKLNYYLALCTCCTETPPQGGFCDESVCGKFRISYVCEISRLIFRPLCEINSCRHLATMFVVRLPKLDDRHDFSTPLGNG